jgi:N-acetylneuraminic acid mutarotase
MNRKAKMMSKLGLLLITISVVGGSAAGQDLLWKEMADLPRSVAGYMAGVVHGKLVIVGGTYWENKQKHWSDLVQVYDPATNQWTNDAALPMPRSDAAAAVLNDDLYLFGGESGSDVRKDGLVLHQGKWSPVPDADLPEPRQFAGAIASGGYIYVLGGVPGSDYGTVAATFWRWKPKMKKWEVLPPLPGPGRISMAMAEVNGEIYTFGGATTGPKDVQNLGDAYRYDPGKRTWKRLPDLGIANRAWWAVGLGSRAVILGGYTNDFAADVYVYEQNNLEKTSPLLHPLADAKFFRIGDKIVGTGGEAAPGIRGKWTMEAEIPAAWGRR